MTNWRPSGSVDAARRRAAIAQRIRNYFAANDVLEVDTPALSPYAVTDPQLESLEVQSALSAAPMYLHTSPEFAMKRLLAAGYPDCYSIARVFRDGEAGQRHQPEFTMVEWYRLDMRLEEIISDTVNVIAQAMQNDTLAANVQRLDYRDAFQSQLGIDPLSASIEDLIDIAAVDNDLRISIGDERNDWLDFLLATRIGNQFDRNEITVIQHYPADQAALARICPENKLLADRFEVFIGPTELANGYVELTDPEEQSRRMTRDQQDRERRDRPIRARDELLLAAMHHGLPACAGVALGLERLQMIYDKSDDIGDVVTFVYDQ